MKYFVLTHQLLLHFRFELAKSLRLTIREASKDSRQKLLKSFSGVALIAF
jgi:hypothetical protein